jgi:hypothetical protein
VGKGVESMPECYFITSDQMKLIKSFGERVYEGEMIREIVKEILANQLIGNVNDNETIVITPKK